MAIKLAGVTFNNDPEDGGASRQDLLKKIWFGGEPIKVDLDHCIFHNKETGKDEDAVKVRTQNGTVIGWIPRTEIPTVSNISNMLLTVGLYKNCYHGMLNFMQKPTPKQYKCVKSLYNKGIIKKMPIYDRRIYARTINACTCKETI